MSSFELFQKHFQFDNLKRIYQEYVLLSSATGVDNMSHEVFWRYHDQEIKTIERKCLLGSYRFNKYKLKLISKGKGKVPREISIPTIRDKIALRAICDFLQELYQNNVNFELPQDMVLLVNEAINSEKYDYVMKFDVANFYPSIRHDKLISSLRGKIRDERILSLIESAIQSPTVSKPKQADELSKCGVPQGLSISNFLAAIYLLNIDKYFRRMVRVKYFRYVDDVMILCDHIAASEITAKLLARFKRLGLTVYDPKKHPEKSSAGFLKEDEFGYLGYYFSQGKVSARKGSVDNLRESILAIFTGYKHSKIKSIKFLEWRVNLRVTGCIFQNKSRGWMYFFSQITDETLLHELDDFIKRLCVRFGINELHPKSFVRTYYQIKYNRKQTSYIPNFDRYDIEQKSYVLNNYFNKSTKDMTDEQIEYHFKKRIAKQVKDIETDVKDAGY